ncbi:hypothetical protein GCM10010377_61700 [Streptomyces viridiviolaceus]|uniref:MFS transporter n=1 Tax=Streptomyces viridiviolaceus TaxID=68282 RepID=A0ABW2EEA6_9ACTN|nr:hypothetical protein [Streptomyces viridiviolaceus]GHB62219.1 hypothetical protein GCM10010377_61700 [Streptomyces viridiviolaceus]
MATAATLTPEQIRRRSLQSGTIGAIVDLFFPIGAFVAGHLGDVSGASPR